MTAKDRVYQHLDQNPQAGLPDLQSIFNDIKPNTVKDYLKQWRSQNPDKAPEPKGDLAKAVYAFLDRNPGATITNMKKQFPETKEATLSQYKTRWSKKAEGSESPLSALESKAGTLLKMIEDYERKGVAAFEVPGTVQINKPFKAVNYSLMESLHEEFAAVCKSMDISQRQGIHRAIKMFVEASQR